MGFSMVKENQGSQLTHLLNSQQEDQAASRNSFTTLSTLVDS